MTHTLILLRHGNSDWNQRNLFTGWVDVRLSDQGVTEAKRAGELLAASGLKPEVLYTSVLTRAIQTANLALEVCDRLWIPVKRTWRLNERHYGDLQGLNKAETAEKFGAEQVLLWRRSYAIAPPAMAADDARSERGDRRYAKLQASQIPLTECLKDTVARVLPFWNEAVAPALRLGKRVVVAAHGNSIRALVKYLDDMSDADVVGLNIPTARPLN